MFPLQESLQQQQNGVEWTILSQGSRELEGLLKLVSKERLQLERNFVLATQVCKSELIFIGMFRLFFCWFWKNSGVSVACQINSPCYHIDDSLLV